MSTAPISDRRPAGRPSGGEDQSRVDARRYLSAIRRGRTLIVAIVAVVVAVVVVVSLLLPATYKAVATVVLDVNDPVFGVLDTESVVRELQTLDAQIDSTPVRLAVAEELGVEDPDSLESKYDSSVDPEANLIDISATDQDPETAAAIANAVADVFIDLVAERERARLQNQLEQATGQLSQADPAQADQLEQQIGSLRAQLSAQANELTVVERAEPPDSPDSPRPLRNAVLAFFASLFLGLVFSLARDQLRPGISDARELSRTTGLPILAGLPYVGTRFSRKRRVVSAIEHESYQSLAAGMRFAVPPDEGKLIVITSSVHGEGKTTVTARLGRLLAQAGSRTLLISADLRWPRLHELYGLPLKPGMTEALSLASRAGISDALIPATANQVMAGGAGAELAVLTSGAKPRDPATLLSSEVSREFFAHVRTLGYDYVLIDGPPILGIADVQGLAQFADALILVTRLDRISVENVIDTMDFLSRTPIEALGHVVIGASIETSPYYLEDRSRDLGLEQEALRPG